MHDLTRVELGTAVLALVAIPSTYMTIIWPGHPWPHYLLFLLLIIALAGGTALAIIARWQRGKMTFWKVLHFIPFLVATILIVPAAVTSNSHNYLFRGDGAFMNGFTFQGPRLFQWLRPTDADTLLVWGWMPEFYMSTGLTPATRETQNFNQISSPRLNPEVWAVSSPLRDYFRQRFVADLGVSQPDFIIDAVFPRSFIFKDPELDSVKLFPEVAMLIENNFTKVSSSQPEGRCPRLYVRRDRLNEIDTFLVPISRVTASAERTTENRRFGSEHLDDGGVFEWCDDYWLLPNRTLGIATLDFAATDRVGRIAILNTRNGSRGDRATESVRLSILYDDEIVHSHELSLNPYPYWTIYHLPRSVAAADAVTVEVLSFRGRGGGLNEVKVYRD